MKNFEELKYIYFIFYNFINEKKKNEKKLFAIINLIT